MMLTRAMDKAALNTAYRKRIQRQYERLWARIQSIPINQGEIDGVSKVYIDEFFKHVDRRDRNGSGKIYELGDTYGLDNYPEIIVRTFENGKLVRCVHFESSEERTIRKGKDFKVDDYSLQADGTYKEQKVSIYVFPNEPTQVFRSVKISITKSTQL